jgi:hypothetical protein
VTHGLNIVQRIVHRGIAEVVKELHAVNPRYGRQRVRRPPLWPFG